jgi:hypothetical protein
LTDSAVIHGAGQGGHGEGGFFHFTRTLIQGFISAGQYNGGSVRFVDSAAIEFPADDDRFADADNDAFYLTGGAHYFTNSLVGWAKDDGIDAGSGSAGPVTIVNCWVESCFHEAFAWSETRMPTVIGSVALNSGQGIEAGFGTPNVAVSDSLSTANLVGARFGDNYDWDYNGFLRVTNSLLLYNYRDVWGLNWDDWTYRTNQMDIRGNRLTQLNPNHPDNELWNPEGHSIELAKFLRGPSANVGGAIALRNPGIAAGASNVPVRLSIFTTNWVSMNYIVQSKRGAAIESNYSGTILFSPGQTVQGIPILADRLQNDSEIIRVQLVSATNAQLTSLSRAYLIPQDSAPFRVLVPSGSTWKYPDPSSNLGTTWRTAAYNDSSWRSGPAELGNGDADETTPINIGGAQTRFPTVYFRHQFVPQFIGSAETLVARLKVDDGAVVYLNGQELFRANMPGGTVSYSTLASSSLENAWFTNTVPASTLVAGTNILAVEVHQQALDSSDLSFDFELRQIPPPELRAFTFEKQLVLNWGDAAAVLEEAPTVNGPWRKVSNGGQIVEVTPAEAKKFYRLKKG